MEDAQTVLASGSARLNLVSVVIGGLLAILGGVVGSIVFHKLERNTSNMRLKREKLEQLVDASYRIESWLNERRDVDLSNLSGHENDPGIFPMSEVEMISRLYFPELQKEVYQLSVASASYQKWIAEGRVNMLRNKTMTDEHTEKFKPIYKEMLRTISELVDKASDIMNEISGS